MSAALKGLGERPLIMGILNITPDSFSDGGKYIDLEKATEHALSMAESGADIIDIGGESTRPGSFGVSLEEELERVIPVIRGIRKVSKIPISIDTMKAEVAQTAIEAGANIINDISALTADPGIASVAAESKSYVILMHMRGIPATMQENTDYEDLIGEIADFLKASAAIAVEKGVGRNKIIIDPGLGFGKSAQGNFEILKNLHEFTGLGYPVLIGASRKAFLGKEQGIGVKERMEGSLAAACYAALNGADIIRAHDVAETRKALTIIEKIVLA